MRGFARDGKRLGLDVAAAPIIVVAGERESSGPYAVDQRYEPRALEHGGHTDIDTEDSDDDVLVQPGEDGIALARPSAEDDGWRIEDTMTRKRTHKRRY